MINGELRHHQPKLVRFDPHQSPPLFYRISLSDSIPVFDNIIVSQHYGDEEKARNAFSFFVFAGTFQTWKRPGIRNAGGGEHGRHVLLLRYFFRKIFS